jgi:8-oxo-dGTP pyrophosphatase MutT (NUDIX family)
MQNSDSAAPFPDDNEAYRFPISIKGVVFLDSRVALLQNLRDEWELPGGKLKLGETPKSCVAREISEELNLRVKVGPLIDVWVYHIYEGVDVFIVTYGCYTESPHQDLAHSPEHKSVQLFSLEELDQLKMPGGYKRSIKSWAKQLA